MTWLHFYKWQKLFALFEFLLRWRKTPHSSGSRVYTRILKIPSKIIFMKITLSYPPAFSLIIHLHHVKWSLFYHSVHHLEDMILNSLNLNGNWLILLITWSLSLSSLNLATQGESRLSTATVEPQNWRRQNCKLDGHWYRETHPWTVNVWLYKSKICQV